MNVTILLMLLSPAYNNLVFSFANDTSACLRDDDKSPAAEDDGTICLNGHAIVDIF